MGKTRIKDLPQASTYAADAVIAIDDSVNGTQKLQLSNITALGWKLVSKSSGDTLEANAVNAVVMTGDTTVSLPASSAAGKANAFALTITIQTKGTLTIKNNDGTAFDIYIYGSSFADTGSTSVVDPFTVFNSMIAGQRALFVFEEIATSSAKYKVSINKLTIHDESVTTYSVTFVTNGGSDVATQTVVIGGTATQPPNPTRDNYDFINWCSDPELTTVYDFSTPVTENISLYAKWQTQERVTVTFDSKGGSYIAPQVLVPGSTAITPATPTLTNYTFSAWYKDENFVQVFDFATPVTTDITLYAKYTITDPVTVTFMKDGSVYNTQTVPRNTTVTAPTEPTKTKYNFTGWFTAATGGELVDLTQAVTENKTLYAQYTIKSEYKATVTFMTDDTVYDQREGVIGETLGEIYNATKAGYTFIGWFEKNDAGAYTTEFTGSTVLTGNLTVYAKFSDVSDWANILDSIQDLTVGNDLVAPPAYGFDSIVFEVVDKDHVPVSGYTKTVTLQTKYLLSKPDKSIYEQRFDESSKLWKDSSIRTWLNGDFLNAFLKNADGTDKTGDDLVQAQTFLNSIKTPTIGTYTASGIKESTTDKVWLPSIYEVGSGEIVPTNSWGKEGHVLDKYSESLGTGPQNERVKTATGGTSDWYWLRSAWLNGEAVWSANGSLASTRVTISEGVSPLITLAYNTCTVTYKYNDGVTADTTQTRAVGAHAVKINPIRAGYYFDAWYTDESLTTKFDFTNTTLTGNLTLYAKWRDVDWTNISAKMATMNVGDLIEAPSAYGFDKIVLEMVDRDHVNVEGVDHTTTHTVTLQTKCLLTKTDGSVYTCVWNENIPNNWETSNIRTWLNGDFLSAFLKKADGTDKTGDDLVQSQAFINAIQSAIIETEPYSLQYGCYTTNDKVWIPSMSQVNALLRYITEGPVLDKYSMFETTMQACIERIKTTTGADGKGTGGSSDQWWLRTPEKGWSAGIYGINSSGGVNNDAYDILRNAIGISPLMTFKY